MVECAGWGWGPWQKTPLPAPWAPAPALPPSLPAKSTCRWWTQRLHPGFRDSWDSQAQDCWPWVYTNSLPNNKVQGVSHSNRQLPLVSATRPAWGCFPRLCQAPLLRKARSTKSRTQPPASDGPHAHELWVLLLHGGFRNFIYVVKCIEGSFAVVPGRILDFVEICLKKPKNTILQKQHSASCTSRSQSTTCLRSYSNSG